MTHLTLEVRDDTGVFIRRVFAAPPAAIFCAHTDAALVRQWMTGSDGWTMTRCEIGAEGGFRHDWADAAGTAGFHLTDDVLEVDPPRRIVHVKRMFLPEATPDNRI